MSEIALKSIRIYPIKACGGIEVVEAQVEERGFQYDRRWMLINDAGTHFDQLDYPRLASVVPQIREDGLLLQAPRMSPLRVPFHLEQTASVCRLVFMPETARRAVNPTMPSITLSSVSPAAIPFI